MRRGDDKQRGGERQRVNQRMATMEPLQRFPRQGPLARRSPPRVPTSRSVVLLCTVFRTSDSLSR